MFFFVPHFACCHLMFLQTYWKNWIDHQENNTFFFFSLVFECSGGWGFFFIRVWAPAGRILACMFCFLRDQEHKDTNIRLSNKICFYVISVEEAPLFVDPKSSRQTEAQCSKYFPKLWVFFCKKKRNVKKRSLPGLYVLPDKRHWIWQINNLQTRQRPWQASWIVTPCSQFTCRTLLAILSCATLRPPTLPFIIRVASFYQPTRTQSRRPIIRWIYYTSNFEAMQMACGEKLISPCCSSPCGACNSQSKYHFISAECHSAVNTMKESFWGSPNPSVANNKIEEVHQWWIIFRK